MFCRTVPLLEGGPLHVDVGFVRQVDLTGSFKNSPCLVHTLRLQVLSVLNDTYNNMLHRDHRYTHSQRLYNIYAHKHTSLSHPEPELLVQSAGDEAALKEDANPVVVLSDRSIL